MSFDLDTAVADIKAGRLAITAAIDAQVEQVAQMKASIKDDDDAMSKVVEWAEGNGYLEIIYEVNQCVVDKTAPNEELDEKLNKLPHTIAKIFAGIINSNIRNVLVGLYVSEHVTTSLTIDSEINTMLGDIDVN